MYHSCVKFSISPLPGIPTGALDFLAMCLLPRKCAATSLAGATAAII